jgi:hypothetical protein
MAGIHATRRAGQAFYRFSAALQENLLSEFFGYEKGAFTGGRVEGALSWLTEGPYSLTRSGDTGANRQNCSGDRKRKLLVRHKELHVDVQ